ncbi:MAG: elongation factor T [Parcubacteria group bacterium Gr01-1014_17]|nr:MAG: elongation factor T [Parcubacteria group bacterium Gr01-1014_17]
MEITTDQIKALRDKTGVSVMQCRKALTEAGGDAEKALLILKKRGAEAAAKKSGRALGAGAVASYIHPGATVGALVLLSSETDFVSRNPEFQALARDIAMHVAAMNPEKGALLDQPFIKTPDETVRGLIEKAIQKFGERIEVADFTRFAA